MNDLESIACHKIQIFTGKKQNHLYTGSNEIHTVPGHENSLPEWYPTSDFALKTLDIISYRPKKLPNTFIVV
jgi:hypothetical protein